jgi:hypothetical protein
MEIHSDYEKEYAFYIKLAENIRKLVLIAEIFGTDMLNDEELEQYQFLCDVLAVIDNKKLSKKEVVEKMKVMMENDILSRIKHGLPENT